MAKTKSRRQVRFLLSKGSPLTGTEKARLKSELHSGEVRVVPHKDKPKKAKTSTPPAGVRAFDPRPGRKAGVPAPPASFSPMRGEKSIPGAAPASQPPMADIAKGNPANKGDGSKNFVGRKAVMGGPTGGLARVAGNKTDNPADVQNFTAVPRKK